MTVDTSSLESAPSGARYATTADPDLVAAATVPPGPSRPRSVRMAATDKLVLGAQASLLVGPVDLPSREDLSRAFVRIAALGPSARLGLTFGEAGQWIWHGEAIAARVDEIFRVAPVPGPQAREWLATHPVGDLPIQFAISGSYFALVVDHSILDGYLGLDLPGILIDVARGGPIPPLFSGLTPRPLSQAIAQTWGLSPRRWLELVRSVREQRRIEGAPSVPTHGASPAVEPGVVATRVSAGRGPVRNMHVTMDGSQLAAFRRWSRGRVGFSASLVLLAAAAVRTAGIDVAPRGVLVVSGRRYLPSGAGTLGNLIAGVNLPLIGPGAEPEVVEARLQDALATGRPLAALALAALRLRLSEARAALRRPTTASPGAPASPPTPARMPRGHRTARVSVSNDGILRSLSGLPWLAPRGERLVEVVGDATDPGGIGMITYIVDGNLHLVVSFREDGFDIEAVRRCAELLATRPVELMTAVGNTAARAEETE